MIVFKASQCGYREILTDLMAKMFDSVCIPIENFSSKIISARYLNRFSSCEIIPGFPSIEDAIVSYYTSLENHAIYVNLHFKSLKSSL